MLDGIQISDNIASELASGSWTASIHFVAGFLGFPLYSVLNGYWLFALIGLFCLYIALWIIQAVSTVAIVFMVVGFSLAFIWAQVDAIEVPK